MTAHAPGVHTRIGAGLDRAIPTYFPSGMRALGLSVLAAWALVLAPSSTLITETDDALRGMRALGADGPWLAVVGALICVQIVLIYSRSTALKAASLLVYVVFFSVVAFLVLITTLRTIGLIHVTLALFSLVAFVRQTIDASRSRWIVELLAGEEP